MTTSGWAVKKKKKTNRLIISDKKQNGAESSLDNKLVSITSHVGEKPQGLQSEQFVDLPDEMIEEEANNAVNAIVVVPGAASD